MRSVLKNYILQLKEIQQGKPWIGSSYESKLERLDESMVFVQSIEGMHSIAEIFSHCTFWRQEALLKIKTGKGSKKDSFEENWEQIRKLKTKGWKTIKLEYKESLTELLKILEQKNDNFLDQKYYDTDFEGTYPYRFLIEGMLHHDIYHLGQLGIIIKYLKYSIIDLAQPQNQK